MEDASHRDASFFPNLLDPFSYLLATLRNMMALSLPFQISVFFLHLIIVRGFHFAAKKPQVSVQKMIATAQNELMTATSEVNI